MKWTVLVVPSGGGEAEYRIPVEGEALPCVGDHVVVQRKEEQKKRVLKVRQIVHSLSWRDEKSALDEVTVEAEPLHHMYDYIE
jgi:hypothetical protein